MQVLDPTNDLANHAKVVVELVVDEVWLFPQHV